MTMRRAATSTTSSRARGQAKTPVRTPWDTPEDDKALKDNLRQFLATKVLQ